MTKKPTIIGSEGFGGLYPENTLSAVVAALDAGVDGVELDFHLSKDGILIAHHDYRLNKNLIRDANGQWLESTGPALKSLTLDQIKTYDAGRSRPGSAIEKAYPSRLAKDGERLTTLEEVAAAVSKKENANTEIWIEIKSSPFENKEIASEPDQYLAALEQYFCNNDLKQRACVINFDWRMLRLLQERFPSVPTGYLTISPKWLQGNSDKGGGNNSAITDHGPMHDGFTLQKYGSYPKAVRAAGGTYWSPFIRDLTADLVDEAHDLGLKVSTWAADGDKLMAKALALGVDSITNSRPDLLLALRDR